jgi:predicted GTPase
LSLELKELGILKRKKKEKRIEKQKKSLEAANSKKGKHDGNKEKSHSHSKAGTKDEDENASENENEDDNSDAPADSDATSSDDEIVQSNRVRFSGALGRLEDEKDEISRLNASASSVSSSRSAASPESSLAFLTIGCLGQPNAGKSSVINALAGRKIVSVSKTPGHTKYLQVNEEKEKQGTQERR